MLAPGKLLSHNKHGVNLPGVSDLREAKELSAAAASD